MVESLIDADPALKPFANHIAGRSAYITHKTKELLGTTSLTDFSLGHLYFGLHKDASGWTLREWAPNASSVFLVGDCNNWQPTAAYRFTAKDHGVWELNLPLSTLTHGTHYKLQVKWPSGQGLRIPAYAPYVKQDAKSKEFSAVVCDPNQPFEWSHPRPTLSQDPPLIYEAHVGMSSETLSVSSYQAFARDVLPRIKKAGYTTVQLMAIQEHPYYGSFGYQVSNFFAVSSRFGTPDDFKHLVDTAHGQGLRVIVDLVHSHAAKNEHEGLGRFDGTFTHYFHSGKQGIHPVWGTRLFNYGKPEVAHFLLSNCRWWLDEYHVDGFRFDGVTSMLYLDHGLGKNFTSYEDYFSSNVDQDALTYLTLANQLIHTINPSAITIAEDMSGYPGLASPLGAGFDYRLSMGVPDIWIKTLEKPSENWHLGSLVHELTTKRPEEKVISYSESHDQALVGDKTLIFRLLDKAMYDHMRLDDTNQGVNQGIRLLKMIRLLTASLHGGGYLNFMGNEFGHPEWIDFPREGNDWSYHYARRQWSLVDNPDLKYRSLAEFDTAMLSIIKKLDVPASHMTVDQDAQVISFERNGYVFVFNFSQHQSYKDYAVPAPHGTYARVLASGDTTSDGTQQGTYSTSYPTIETAQGDRLVLQLPSRSSSVLCQQPNPHQ